MGTQRCVSPFGPRVNVTVPFEPIRALGELAGDELRRCVAMLPEADARAIAADWPSWAHDGQLPPDDDWRTWVQLAGRGFGKTRAGAEYVSAFAGPIRTLQSR